MTVATMPERADTSEAIGQIMFAPLLYSMVSNRLGEDQGHASPPCQTPEPPEAQFGLA